MPHDPPPTPRIALFGGTFDPPHLGHLLIASEAVREMNLTKVIFVPCHQSPHKHSRPGASDGDRLAMLRLATRDLEWAEISDFEISRSAPSYSWRTATYFSETLPTAEWFWIMGADQWAVIEKWSHPEVLARLLTFIVFPRNGAKPVAQPPFRSHFLTSEIDVSATEIREKIRRSADVRDLISEAVRLFIHENHLYKE